MITLRASECVLRVEVAQKESLLEKFRVGV